MLLQLPGRKEAARILDPLGQIAVEPDCIPGNPELLLEPLDQPDQMGHLTIGEPLSVTISHETDADGVGIVLRTGGSHDMGTRQLIIPSISHVDFTVPYGVNLEHP